MKPSHLQTPRTLSDCTFTQGYQTAEFQPHIEPTWEVVAGYVLAVAIGVGLAACLFFGLSS